MAHILLLKIKLVVGLLLWSSLVTASDYIKLVPPTHKNVYGIIEISAESLISNTIVPVSIFIDGYKQCQDLNLVKCKWDTYKVEKGVHIITALLVFENKIYITSSEVFVWSDFKIAGKDIIQHHVVNIK